MKKNRLTAEEKTQVIAAMKALATEPSAEKRERVMATTLNFAYDEEMPIAKPLERIANFTRIGNRPEENRFYVIKPFGVDKDIYILDSTCVPTQTKVTPGVRTEVTHAEVSSPDFYVCLNDFVSGDYDALAVYTDNAHEMVDRYEIKYCIDLLDAAAVANSNVFTLDSDKTALDYPKLVEMVRTVAKYGTDLVILAGANIWTDFMLMDYLANTYRKYGAAEAGVEVIPIETQTLDVDASGQEVVLDADTAYLVATSDRMQNRPLQLARRMLDVAANTASDTTAVKQDRIVIESGFTKHIGSSPTLTKGRIMYEHFFASLIQGKNVVRFKRV